MRTQILASIISVAFLGACTQAPQDINEPSSEAKMSISKAADIWPKLDIEVKADPAVEQKVTDIMADMTLEQKIAQMQAQ